MVKGICLDRKTVTAMLDLHDREWKEFRICDIFIIKAGKRLTKSDMTSGNKPFIGATDNNNGITEFVSNTNVSEDCNVLGVNYNGSVVENFYHPYTCIFSDDVKRFQTKQVQGNKYIYLFMKTVILQQKCKYAYGYKFNEKRMQKQSLLLPVDESGNPDYAFMEQYIKERERQIVQNYIDYIGNNIQIGGGITPLNQKDWKGFFFEDVVTILPGRDIYDAERIPGKTPYVSSSSVNNGICHFVNNANDTLEANCISVNRNGSVGFAFYHPYEALFSNDCRKLRPKYEGNYISLFIATQITAQRNKYSYGYKMGTARLKRQKIMLPTTDNGTPDYDYMEQYVRQQIATLKLQYLQGKMTVAI